MRHSVDNLNKPSMKIAAIICVLIIVMVCYFVFFKKNGEMKGPIPASGISEWHCRCPPKYSDGADKAGSM